MTESNPTDAWDSRVNDLFLQAAEIVDEHARTAFLDEQCGDDERLRKRIDSMLRDQTEAAGFFDKPDGICDAVASVARTTDSLRASEGAMLGRYKLLQRIGEGGFGVVYMAEQEEPVRRQVALKVIKPGMDTREVVARFEAERQALAMMDHPNIAKVLDGGTTEDSRPYFVMELVKGVPITEFCDKNNLRMVDRLRLFVRVCSAVQHAHQKGVIHRDIKPSNVMITLHDSDPVPKIIDFGIAKATAQPLTEKTLFTRYGQMIGTPQYMSPEQAEMSGLDIDTRTDIYSLGILLYELLTGTTPLDGEKIRSVGFAEMVRLVQETEPPKPSQRISSLGDDQAIIARRRGADSVSLSKAIAGDLDWIVMKAIEKDRNRRYGSASDLSQDIQRHLDGDPVEAVAPSLQYRLSKLIAKHRFYVSAAALLLTTLIGATIFSAWQASLAWKAEENMAMEKANALIAKNNEERARKEVERQAEELQRLTDRQRLELYASDMARADRFLADGNLAAVRRLLDVHEPADDSSKDLRGFEWHYLKMQSRNTALRRFEAVGHEVRASKDGRFFAHRRNDQVVIRNQTAPWSVITELDNDGASFSFTPDGEYLAVGSDSDVTVYKTEDWSEAHAWPNAHYPVRISRDGKLIAFISKKSDTEDEMTLCSMEDWKEIDRAIARPFGMGWWQSRDQLEFTHDGKWLIFMSGVPQSTVFHWSFYDIENRRLVPDYLPDATPGFSLSVSKDSRHLAVSKWNTEIWDFESRSKIATLEEHLSFISCTEYSPDGKYLVTAAADKKTVVWNTDGYQQEQTLLGSPGEIWGLDMTHDSRFILNSSMFGSERYVSVWPLQPSNTQNRDITGFPAGTTSDGTLVVVSPDNRIRGWRGNRKTFEFAIDGRMGMSGSFFFPACITGNNELLLGMQDGSVQVWNLDDQTLMHTLKIDSTMVTTVHSDPRDHTLFAVGTDGGTAAIWSLKTREQVTTVQQANHVRSVHYSDDGNNLAVVTQVTYNAPDRTGIRVYDLSEQLPTLMWSKEESHHYLSFSPNRDFIAASRASENKIHAYDFDTGKLVASMEGSLGGVDTVDFSPDGKTLASACNDNTVKLWHVPTWIEMVNLTSPEVPVAFFASNEANRLVMGSRTGDPFMDMDVSSGGFENNQD